MALYYLLYRFATKEHTAMNYSIHDWLKILVLKNNQEKKLTPLLSIEP